MKSTHTPSGQLADSSALKMGTLLMASVIVVLGAIGALNGGTALTTGAWDSTVTYINSLLTSTWLFVLAFTVLVVAVWQLAHGGGYRSIGLILGVLAIALVGPGVVRSIATATAAPGSVTSAPAAIVIQQQ